MPELKKIKVCGRDLLSTATKSKEKRKSASEDTLEISKKERSLPAGSATRGQLPMELLTPRELSQTPEVKIPTGPGRVTTPDPSDTLGDPVVEKTMKQLVEAADRLVRNMSVSGSGVTAPYGTIDDNGRVQLS